MEAMGRLAGGISHDFNNLLGVMIGYSDLMLASTSLDDRTRHQIEQVKKAGHRAASLTGQLLAFSRKQVLTPKVLDLNTVVSETSKMLHRLLGEDIELITKLAPVLDHVKADPTQIEQVIMNLVINARDAMPRGGKLIIETANAELDRAFGQHLRVEVQPGNYVLLAVSDTGIGMDRKTQARIFEPFFTTKDKGKGTGLGLATVYGIVRQSGGYIWVYSEVGEGTTFKIYIPRFNEMPKEVQPEAITPLATASGTILLVEDEESLRDVSHQLLKSMGYTVIEAANGADAIRIASQCSDPIDLLITDVVMPGMNGRELAELLLASRSRMRVLYVSGHTDDAIVHYSIHDHGMAFLQKPFTRDGLAKKIQEMLGASGGTTDRASWSLPMSADPGVGLRLLVIDDEAQNLGLIESALEQQGLEILTATDPEAGLALFQEERPEIVLLDLVMPKMNGMDLLEQIIASDPGAEVILMTGHYSAESAVEAIRKGAADYLTKPLDVGALRDRVFALVNEHRSRRFASQLDQQMVDTFQLEGIVGRSPLIMDVFATIRRVAPHFRTALITGETGTGKELVAHALHRLSPVSDKTFAVCNCSALVETLFESELFGHVRGAFTGATQDKVGLFEYAHQGTVFLDEIGDMPLAGQAKLLRVLQNQEVQRVGSPTPAKSGRALHSRNQQGFACPHARAYVPRRSLLPSVHAGNYAARTG